MDEKGRRAEGREELEDAIMSKNRTSLVSSLRKAGGLGLLAAKAIIDGLYGDRDHRLSAHPGQVLTDLTGTIEAVATQAAKHAVGEEIGCLTPGAVFHIHTEGTMGGTGRVTIKVSGLPDIGDDEAVHIRLKQRLHRAVESVLAGLYD
jgi:hypothetical protein